LIERPTFTGTLPFLYHFSIFAVVKSKTDRSEIENRQGAKVLADGAARRLHRSFLYRFLPCFTGFRFSQWENPPRPTTVVQNPTFNYCSGSPKVFCVLSKNHAQENSSFRCA
jgi:hypothetical protein